MAKFGSLIPSGGPDVSVTPALTQDPSVPWTTSGFSYACGAGGGGILEVTNNGSHATNVTAISLTYGGSTYAAAGPSCVAPPGASAISLTGLNGSSPPAGTPFKGRLTLGDGAMVSFAGSWA